MTLMERGNMGKLSRIHAIALSAVMALAIAVPFAIAQSKDDGGHKGRHVEGSQGMRGGDRMGGAFFRNLDLTDAQKAQMKQIREAHSQNLRPLMEQIRAKRQEIHQANQGGTFNESLVSQKLTEIAPLEAKLMGEQFRTHQEMLSVLTAEQKAKLEQSRDQQKSKWSERRANKQTAR
jgi:periplasmic protein CpxP/Spy